MFRSQNKLRQGTIWPSILGYGALASLVLVCLLALRHSHVMLDWSTELYSGLAGLLFLALGVWVGRSIWLTKRRLTTNATEPLSDRELEVLEAVSSGSSNQEIADQLFISLSTVKTHLSNIFNKLGAKRRTQAIQIARELEIIA